MRDFSFSCPLQNGLHARPASALEEVARRFSADLTMTNLRTGRAANAKSVLAMVSLDLRFEDRCSLAARGVDEHEAIVALTSFIGTEFPRCDAPLPPRVPERELRLPPVLRLARPTTCRGTPVAPGVGRGRFVTIGGLVVPEGLSNGVASDVDAELGRLDDAFARLLDEYDSRLHRMARGVQAEIVSAHRSVARDPEFRQWLSADIAARRSTAAAAVLAADAHFSAMLIATGSAILRDRALDVRDVCVQLVKHLPGVRIDEGETRLDGESVCWAEDLTPGQFLSFDRRVLKGVVLQRGSATSHTAILARSFGIPMIVGVTGLDRQQLEHHDVIVDGDLGLVVADPDGRVLRYYDMERARLGGRTFRQQAAASQPAVTRDGTRVEIGANIASAAEAGAAFAAGAEGIGLFRTELLFAEGLHAPSEASQFEEYRAALEAAGSRRVLIRTIDVGGDKPLPYLALPAEDNPFLGYRGVRIYREHDSLLRAQVRALVRASAHGSLGLMIPMVSRLDEVRAVRAVVAQEQARCAAEHVAFDPAMQVGAMIEVPSAAFALPELAGELDFFSVGTNDLLQYFVAADRTNLRVAGLYDALTPAFLRLLKKIVDDVHAAGKWVGVCGEMAGDPAALPLLVGMAFDEISVGPARLGAAKSAVCRLSGAACRDLLAAALGRPDPREVAKLVSGADLWSAEPLIEPQLVVLDADCRTREEAIKAAADCLFVAGRTDAPRGIEDAVWERESVYSTGFGHGFAIPHCRTNQVHATSMALVRLKQPVEWNALDLQPVGVVVLLAVRESDHAVAHMKILATLARQLMHDDFREYLSQEPDARALCSYLLDRIGG
jgi:phosphoenolpyruvate-protein phosphotransferase